jgi:hypothetical protein
VALRAERRSIVRREPCIACPGEVPQGGTETSASQIDGGPRKSTVVAQVRDARRSAAVLRVEYHVPRHPPETPIDAGLVKLDEKVGVSKKLARYLPFWA